MLKAKLGIRGRILSIALVPSTALLVVGLVIAGMLLIQGRDAQSWAAKIDKDSAPGIEFAIQTQEERRLTLLHLGGGDLHAGSLVAQRARVDRAVQSIVAAGDAFSDFDPTMLAANIAAGKELVAQLPNVRSKVDASTLRADEAYTYFNQLIGVAVGATELFPRVSPTPETAAEESVATRLLHVAEAMSRGNAWAAAGVVSGRGLSGDELRTYVREIGFYHAELGQLGMHLAATDQTRLRQVLTSRPWQQLAMMEDAIISRGAVVAEPEVPAGRATAGRNATEPLPLSVADWQDAATAVSVELLELWKSHHQHALRSAAAEGDRIAQNSLVGGGAALAVSVVAFLIAAWLARRLILRLRLLRRDALTLADTDLPRVMDRLRAGLPVDLDTDVTRLDYGTDELGQVAAAFNNAQRAAVSAAVAEAKTRAGVNALFLNIAYRSQLVIYRQLEVLDKAERDQEDPAQLDLLFQLDHLSTRARRNAENLIILGGGQPGRQWRNPVPLVEITRSAVAETEDYARVFISRVPDLTLVGTVVADLIHLLAELVDNATSFSPPDSKVEITGSVVGRGVAIEIVDQGLGMSAEDMDRVNETLRNPPDFTVDTLTADSRLGLFVVARLAVSHGASVRLTESHFGGVRAIVVLPHPLIVTAPVPAEDPWTSAGNDDGPTPRFEPISWRAAAAQAPVSPSALTASPASTPTTFPPFPAETSTSLPRPASTRPAGGSRKPPLPRRNRQDSLAPELATTRSNPAREHPVVSSDQPGHARTAEQARDLMSAIEAGTRQGRRPPRQLGAFETEESEDQT